MGGQEVFFGTSFLERLEWRACASQAIKIPGNRVLQAVTSIYWPTDVTLYGIMNNVFKLLSGKVIKYYKWGGKSTYIYVYTSLLYYPMAQSTSHLVLGFCSKYANTYILGFQIH